MLAITRYESLGWCEETESYQYESGPWCDVCVFDKRYEDREIRTKYWPQYSDRDLCCEGCGINFYTGKFPVKVDPEKLTELRKRTDMGLQVCRKALEICENGFDDAVEWLRKAGRA